VQLDSLDYFKWTCLGIIFTVGGVISAMLLHEWQKSTSGFCVTYLQVCWKSRTLGA
jgi:hypothetical protein